MRGLILALIIAFCDAGAPSVSVSLGHDKVFGGASLDSVSGSVSMESVLSDVVTAGANFDVNKGPVLKNIFAKIKSKIGSRAITSDLSVDTTAKNFPITGSVDFGVLDDHTTLKGAINTGNPGYSFLDSLTLTTSGDGWSISPTIHLDDGKIDLSTSAKIGDATAKFDVDKAGTGHASMDYELSASTQLSVATSAGLADLGGSISHKLSDSTSLKLSATDRLADFEASISHKLSDSTSMSASMSKSGQKPNLLISHSVGAQTLTAELAALESLSLNLAGGDWSAKASLPCSSPTDCDLSITKKLSLDSIQMPF